MKEWIFAMHLLKERLVLFSFLILFCSYPILILKSCLILSNIAGDKFTVDKVKLDEGKTSPPDFLTEVNFFAFSFPPPFFFFCQFSYLFSFLE